MDRLLASPHFGERWGRHWLDLARYADSDGYEKDSPRPFAYRYRDWVIDAINADMPFDQFTIEQLAGDLLPDATIRQKVATGFHRNTLTNKEGGVDQEEFRVAAVIDRVNTTGTVWLGLTVGCAQCHSHKYDPLLQKEYYSLFAFFNSGQEVDLPAPLPGERERYEAAKAAFEARLQPSKEALATYDRDTRPSRQAEWEKTIGPNASSWKVLAPTEANSAQGGTLTVQPDGSVLASGKNPERDTYTIQARTDLTGITAFRVEALTDPSLPSLGPGRVQHGNFVLNEFRVEAKAEGGEPDGNALALQNAKADYSQGNYPVKGAIDGDPATGWAVSPELGKSHSALFETKDDAGFPGGTILTFTFDQQYGTSHTIGRLRIAATTAPRPVALDEIPDDVREILAIAPEDRCPPQKERLAEYHRSIDPEYQKLAAAVAAQEKKAPKPPTSKVRTLAENPKPPSTHVLIRGDFLRPGEPVEPGTPALLHPLDESAGSTPTRLDLARWLMDPSNPLTARVTVNRMWRHLFGRAIVTTVQDFGTRGEEPSHPELLDWLAREYIALGWSRKGMIRRIVTSATYRQASNERPELAGRDPLNVWLSHQNRVGWRPRSSATRPWRPAACSCGPSAVRASTRRNRRASPS